MTKSIQATVTAVEAPGLPPPAPGDPAIRTDAVYVVYTSTDDTIAAARVASDFAKALHVPVTLIHFRTVPFALPVDAPTGVSPVETDEFRSRLQSEALDIHVRVHLCRDVRRAVPLAFKPHSLIVVAGRRGWWTTQSERWRRRLEAAGHFVVFVDKAEQEQKERSHA
jgi:hypothetical protein